MRKHIFIGALISGVCLYFAFRGLSLREIGQALQHADFRWILTAVGIYVFGFAARAIRWEGLMAPIQRIPARQLFQPLMLGFFANNILPFRMGELVRAHLAGRRFALSRATALGTIVLERIFDAASFLGIFLALAFFYPFPTAIQHGARVMGAGCLTVVVVLWLASTHQAQTHALIARLPLSARWRDKAAYLITHFSQGVSGLRNGSYVLKALLLSLVVWMIEGSTLYLVARAFSIGLAYPEAFFVLFFLGLSVALPQAPGYVGTVELFGTMALGLLGTPKEQALPVILALHGMQFFVIGLLGMFAVWKEGRGMDFWKENLAGSQPN